MPKINNQTVIKYAAPIATALSARGDNWNADAMAAVCVKVVLEEMGCTESLGDEAKNDRAEVINIIKSFFTAPKNFQNSYLAMTEVNGAPMMKAVKSSEKTSNAEFA